MSDRNSAARIADLVNAIGTPAFDEKYKVIVAATRGAHLAEVGPILNSALERHAEWVARGTSDTLAVLTGAGLGLSDREAQVVAALIDGHTQQEIGTQSGLSLSSVITYRRRAYGKLCVGDKRQLARLFRQLRQAAMPSPR